MTARRDAGRRHDGSFDLARSGGPAAAEPEGLRPAVAPVSNRAREALAARDRDDGELAVDDLLHELTGGGAPPLPPPPPPGLGGDPEDDPAPARRTAGEDEQPPIPIALALAGPRAAGRQPPALPAPPAPITPIAASPMARRAAS